jgi:hypothetical protein
LGAAVWGVFEDLTQALNASLALENIHSQERPFSSTKK